MVAFNPSCGGASAALPVLRVAPGGTMVCCLAQEQPLGFGVHWCGSSVICVGDDCPLCESHAARLAYWIIAKPMIGSKFGALGLLEMSGSAFGRMDAHLRMEGVTRRTGAYLEITRRRANSPLICEPLERANEAWEPLPIERTLDAVLVLLKLPRRLPDCSFPEWVELARPMLLQRAARAASL